MVSKVNATRKVPAEISQIKADTTKMSETEALTQMIMQAAIEAAKAMPDARE